MKNNFKSVFLTLIFFLINSICLSNEIEFEAKEINITNDGNLVQASGNAKVKINESTNITSDKFIYDKLQSTLVLIDNVEIIDAKNKLFIKGEKFTYSKLSETITGTNEALIVFDDTYYIKTNNINYNISERIVSSNSFTSIKDLSDNTFNFNQFKFLVSEKLFKGEELVFIDHLKNEYSLNKGMINLNIKEILGKDFHMTFNKETFGNSEQDPRLKGSSVFVKEEESIINNGVFTTCKKTDNCPPWVLSAKEIRHNKEKKTINYKNAWLEIYDRKVFYFPKFFHPDPTVKRQSGFLIPQLLSSNSLGSSLEIPYYKVVSDNKDLTFKPRLFSNSNFLLSTEYRQKNKSSDHIVDFGLNKSHGLADSKSSSKTHFFSNSDFTLSSENFDFGNIKLQLQQTSNKTYLKTYKPSSPLINDDETLYSFLKLELYDENLSFDASTEIFEDLSKEDSDKYEYILPNFDLKKRLIGNNIGGDLYFKTSGNQKLYNTNIKESLLVNNLIYESSKFFSEKGLVSNFDFILKNVNTDAENSPIVKNKKDANLLSSLMLTTSYPLKKTKKTFNTFFTPKISYRFSPNKSKNVFNEDRKININNVNSFNRIGLEDMVEGGQSVTLSTNYKVAKKEGLELLTFDLATVFREKEDLDLPKTSTLGNKQSDIIGNINYKPNKFFNFDYSFSLDNSLDESNYDLYKTELRVNKLITSFEYLEENNEIGTKNYWSTNTSYSFNKQNVLKFNTRRNKETDLTEYYDLIYQYQNDCLIAAIEYNKDYYSDGDLKPTEQIYFSITLVPFTKANSPSVK
tara:strand:- start:3655 stop:6051 length:2397 start_codon:yes stop_codon:yes gene_type:complete